MPDAGRTDYNELITFRQLQPGEPFFFIRGRDAVSGPAVRAWAALALQAGAPAALVESALQQADALDAWPDKHVPDADHLAPDEAQRLEYQLDRRAWNAREAAPGAAVMLAERRGYRAAEARARNTDQLLHQVLEAIAPVLARADWSSDALDRARTVCAAAQLHGQQRGLVDA